MKVLLWTIGKGHEPYVKTGIEEFTKRLQKYFAVEWTIIPTPKNAASLDERELKKREAALVLQNLKGDDYLVALDEKGKSFTSEALAQFIEARAMDGTKTLVFLIGGAFGIDDSVLQKAKLQWSLSGLTFPHQLVRLLLAEQLYRAGTILRNEKYHHK